MTNSLVQLKALGQSIWYDDIDRGELRSSLFGHLIDEDGITGATGNPTIFEHSISNDTAYDEQMQQLIAEGKGAQEIYEALAMDDERQVADLLRPIYDRTSGQDGFVSIEVSPYLAHDTAGTLAEVRRFWHTIARPNLMVKIPATQAGIPAIRQALSEGFNINITLIFAIENYRQVVEAYLSAFEVLMQRGARVQRPLWASTSAKNPAYRDVLYAEELIGPATVDTMPLKTIEALRDHGRVRLSMEVQLREAQAQLVALEEAGIHYDEVTQQLQDEGVQKFSDSFRTLFAGIDTKRKVLQR